MLDLKGKMQQNRFRLGSAPDPLGGGSLQRSPLTADTAAGFKGPTSKGRGRERRERERKGGE